MMKQARLIKHKKRWVKDIRPVFFVSNKINKLEKSTEILRNGYPLVYIWPPTFVLEKRFANLSNVYDS